MDVISALRFPPPGDGARGRAGDGVLFGALLALALVGLLAVYTSSAAVALDRFGDPAHYLVRHLAHLALGVAVGVLLWRSDYRLLDRSAVVHALWAVLLALLVLTLFSTPAGGARRWIRLGEATLQPAELAKIAVVLLCAFQFSRRQDRLHDAWRGLVPPLLLTAQVVLVVALQPDFGTAAFLLLLFGLAAFVAGTPLRLLAGLGVACAAVLGALVAIEPYRLERLRTFLDPGADPLGAGYQLQQSLIAVGSGGLFGCSSDGLLGTGLGCSTQKLFYLPEPHTDFVLAVLAEELGLAGSLLVVLLFAVVLVRGFQVAARCGDLFGTLLASGATAVIGVQALVNMMVVVGLMPTKGLPLPLLSSGGSSLLASCAAAGLLLSVARHG